jgi:hypothetical protein
MSYFDGEKSRNGFSQFFIKSSKFFTKSQMGGFRSDIPNDLFSLIKKKSVFTVEMFDDIRTYSKVMVDGTFLKMEHSELSYFEVYDSNHVYDLQVGTIETIVSYLTSAVKGNCQNQVLTHR